MSLDGLVPTRFLCLIAHLIMVIMIFWVRDYNVKASLPAGYTSSEYSAKDTELIIGLSVALGLFLIEFIGFFGGISMFMHTQGIISILCHGVGAASATYFIWLKFPVTQWWYLSGMTCGVPAFLELLLILTKLVIRRL